MALLKSSVLERRKNSIFHIECESEGAQVLFWSYFVVVVPGSLICGQKLTVGSNIVIGLFNFCRGSPSGF